MTLTSFMKSKQRLDSLIIMDDFYIKKKQEKGENKTWWDSMNLA